MESVAAQNLGKQNSLFYLFGKNWQYSIGNRKMVITYWILFIVCNIIDMISQPLVYAKIMDTIQKEGVVSGNIAFICELLLALVAIDVIFWLFHGPARVIERLNAYKVKGNYKKYLVRGVLTLPLDWHSDHHSGDTIDKIEKGTTALYSFSSESFLVIQSVTQLIVSYAMLTYFSPSAGIIVLAMMVATFLITTRFDKTIILRYRELNKAENAITASIFDSISNITTVIILRVENLIFVSICKKIDEPYDLYRKNTIQIELKWFLTNICCGIMTTIVLSIYFWVNINSAQGVLVGSVFLLFKYLDKLGELFFRFCGMYGDVLQRKSKVANSEELSVDFRPVSFANHVLPTNWETINVGKLNFSYDSKENIDLHLENIEMKIGRGEKIALIGETGSGKTTMLKVIRNLYSPRELTLAVDNSPITEGFGGIARAISLLPQDPEIFTGTILENITLGADHDLETVRKFTDMAGFTEVVESLPKKFESSINEKGVNLSGGEKQRLALARGLLASADKSIILLDEPTSSIDVLTEKTIYENIFREFQGKSIVSSIHRLHLLPMFDHIYMFEHGRIVGHGSFTELLNSCLEFQTLCREYKKHDEEMKHQVVK